MKIKSKDFRVPEGATVDLGDGKAWPTTVKPVYASKKDYQKELAKHVAKLSEQQELLYASNRYAVLLIFQAMDAAGKDGAIKHVMSGVNPQGCQVFSFKHPSAAGTGARLSLAHHARPAGARADRHLQPLLLRGGADRARAPGDPAQRRSCRTRRATRRRSGRTATARSSTWRGTCTRNGTRIVKFFLHLSKEEQRKRFLARIDEPEKNWKFSLADIEERKFWKQYMQAYEECLGATSTERRALVCRARRRQGERAADHLPDRPRHVRRARDGLPEDVGSAEQGIAGDPQAAREVMSTKDDEHFLRRLAMTAALQPESGTLESFIRRPVDVVLPRRSKICGTCATLKNNC